LPAIEELTFACLEGREAFVARQEPWNALLESVDFGDGFPTYYASPQWLDQWTGSMGPDFAYYTFVAEHNGKWQAVLPMMVRKTQIGKFNVTALMLSSWPELDNFEVPAVSQEVRDHLVSYALDYAKKSIRGWEVLLAREISIDGPTHQSLQKYFQTNGQDFRTEAKALSPVLDLAEYNAREEKMTKKQAYRLRKFRRKAERTGEVESVFVRATPENCMELYDECADVEARSWKGREDLSAAFMLNDPRKSFYRKLWQAEAARGQLAVALIRLDGLAIAEHWGMIDRGRFLSYHMCFDNDHRSLGLGAVLLDDMIEASPGLGVQIYDSSRGSTDGRHILANYNCPYRNQLLLTFYRPSVKGRFLKFAREVVKPALAKKKEDE
jgi:CelD/BcsL family acetyltransferase involved in cellulose biosynthesis